MVLDTEMRRALYLFYISEGKSNLRFLCYEHESGFLTKIYFQNRQEAVQLCTGTFLKSKHVLYTKKILNIKFLTAAFSYQFVSQPEEIL